MENMIFETHAHYDDCAFDEDRDELLSAFPDNNIYCVIDAASTVKSHKLIFEMAEKYPFLYGTVGVHPDEIKELNEEIFEGLSVLCENEKAVAVGEVGLDYYWNKDNKPSQKYWFSRFIELAKSKKLPLIIHSREAAADTVELLREERAFENDAVIHCYSYSKELAKDFLDMGFYFGIGGVSTFKNARKLIETIEYILLSSILLETDSPYLAPVPYRGKRNCSLYIPFVAEKIAQIKKISEEEVLETTKQNALAVFKKIAIK